MPVYSDEQLNKIFNVAIKPKDLNQKNTILKLFRVFKNKKNHGQTEFQNQQGSKPHPSQEKIPVDSV